jgi:hypothetical protein
LPQFFIGALKSSDCKHFRILPSNQISVTHTGQALHKSSSFSDKFLIFENMRPTNMTIKKNAMHSNSHYENDFDVFIAFDNGNIKIVF